MPEKKVEIQDHGTMTCGTGMGYVQRLLLAGGILVLLAVAWYAIDILILTFAGILLAVLIRAPADWLSSHSALSGGWSVLVVLLGLVLLLAAGGWGLAVPIIGQFNTLTETLPKAAETLQQQLRGYSWGDWLEVQLGSIDWSSRRINVLGRMTGALSTILGTLADVIILTFSGLYLAFQPHIYINGLIRLVPVNRRPRMRQVLEKIGRTLQWWLVGILLYMTIIGLFSGLGLWLLGIPFAMVLGLLAGVLSFVPYLGAIVSSFPAMLIALTVGPEHVLYVMALYLSVHLVEGYLLNPLIQQKVVSLPAALVLFAQVMMGILLGLWGIILATPMAAAILVAVKMLYIEDVLRDTGEETRADEP